MHLEYSEHLTDEKVELIKGPYTCAKFAEEDPDTCSACPHWDKISSPIVLGMGIKKTYQRTYLISRAIFSRSNVAVYIRFKDKDGNIEDKVIYQNDLYVIKRIMDVEVGEAIVMRLHLPKMV